MFASAAKRAQLVKAIKNGNLTDTERTLMSQTATKPDLTVRQADALITRIRNK